MLDVRYSSRFKKDLKLCAKRKLELDLLMAAVDTLRIPEPLPRQNRDHPLTGNWSGYQECHISPDWLLVYSYRDGALFLYRTGSHSDLFGKT